MIGEVIQEYLVALGARIDKPGFREMDQTIKQSGELITKATGSWAANFVKASTIIASAIAGVKAATLGLMTAAAKQDLEMEKFARRMMMSREAAEQMKRATDALGESVQDITLSPELSERFRQLSAEGGQMMIGGDFKETMRNFRDLIFEFTRLKQEASYAMTWIGYYLMKYLQKPLAEIREKFREFNDSFVKNISTWTEKAARAIVYIVEMGRHFLQFLWDVGKALYNIWDSFPKGVKIASAALAGFWLLLKASPLGRMIALVSALMLLVDDYYGYMEGKNAALGPLWDKLNDAIEYAKDLWTQIVPVLEKVAEWAEETAQAFMDWFDEMSQDKDVRELIDALREMGSLILDLGREIWDFVRGALADLWDGFSQTELAYTFSDALREVLKFVKELFKYFGWATSKLKDFFKVMRDSAVMSQFWKTQGQEAKRFLDILIRAVGAAGKLGQALLLLTRGKWEDAWKTGNEAWDLLMGNSNKRDAAHGGGGGSFDNGSWLDRGAGVFGAAGRFGAGVGSDVSNGLMRGLNNVVGKSMDLAEVGCVEAAEKIGMEYSQFLKDEYDKGVRYLPTLVDDAKSSGIGVIDYDESQLSPGDLVTWRNHEADSYMEHVGVFIGYKDGVPYVADNSSGENQVVERPLDRSWQENEYIIKTGGSGYSPQYVAEAPTSGWRDSLQAMQTSFASSGVYQTPPYIGGGSQNVSIGDIIVNIQGGANASAEELGRAFGDQMRSFFPFRSAAQISPAWG